MLAVLGSVEPAMSALYGDTVTIQLVFQITTMPDKDPNLLRFHI